ncbi:hypothetical protein ACFYT3_20735 [Nocardia amikacinitolerans]|uniref:hypothetical protein n=1 Tax=Nocardia amikacinitolerans TaxID=756689 RepID=UPI0020A2CF93|nr:hypothetical protein [Nocardia amikacinitolerans]MCP2289884.1 hypothetical protein [Nocardia amikacinitolerans]
MAPGDGPPEGGPETSGGSPPPDTPALAPHGPMNDAVESVWLGRRRTPVHLGRPRLSTLLMLAAFVAVLVLYIALRPGG